MLKEFIIFALGICTWYLLTGEIAGRKHRGKSSISNSNYLIDLNVG